MRNFWIIIFQKKVGALSTNLSLTRITIFLSLECIKYVYKRLYRFFELNHNKVGRPMNLSLKYILIKRYISE